MNTLAVTKEPFQPQAVSTAQTDLPADTKTDKCAPSASEISAVHKNAKQHEKNYIVEAVICGQMMTEKLLEMWSGNAFRSTNRNQYSPQDQSLANWLLKNCPEIEERTARNWRTAAVRTIAIVVKSHHAEPVARLDFGGEKFYVSTILRMPRDQATAEMIQFQEKFQSFLADKTLYEVTRCALNGCGAPHNIDRAANGKTKGGTRGENRRDYAKFITVHFKELNHLIGRWDKFIEKDPSQHAKMTEALRNVILGGRIKIEEKGRPIEMPGWPASFSKLIEGILKEQRKNTQE